MLPSADIVEGLFSDALFCTLLELDFSSVEIFENCSETREKTHNTALDREETEED